MTRPRTRLYLITPPQIADVDTFEHQLDEALAGGDIACLQIRLKSGEMTDAHAVRKLGKRITARVQDRGVAVLINDSAELAVELGADGVHIGQSDMSYKDVRRLVGEDGIVGVTCHASRHLAMLAGEQGADYVAFGAFYPTTTKATQHRAETDILDWWQETMEVPCVAIGGVTAQTAGALARAGADFIAVSSAVWDHPEGPRAGVAAINAALDEAN